MKKLLFVLIVALAACSQSPPAEADNSQISWTAPTLDTDGKPIVEPLTYRIYGALSGQSKTILTTTATLAFTHVTTIPGNWCYDVTAATPLLGESDHSNEACKILKGTKPAKTNAPTVQ
jgi:hypothetical protein